MKRLLGAMFLLAWSIGAPVFAFNYVKPDVLKQWMEEKRAITIIDTQPPADFAEHHLKGSVETNSYPTKAREEKKRLDDILPRIRSSKKDLVIICPEGRNGAQNAYTYLKSKGISEKRLYILNGGAAGWPYKELLQKGR